MEDVDKIKQRFELLKIARELLNEDYINRRAEDHNKWVAENEESWRTIRRHVPYPPFAQYPSDESIVRAASNLYNFIYRDEINASEKPHAENTKITPDVESVQPEIQKTPAAKTAVETQPLEPEIQKNEEMTTPIPDSIDESSSEHPELVQVTGVNPKPVITRDDVRELEAKVMEAKIGKNFLPGWVRRTLE